MTAWFAKLGLRSARFVAGAAAADVPLLTRTGRVVPTLSHWTLHGFELPERASIPVVAGNGVIGHVAIEATPGRGVSLDERRVAVALADLLAVAIERSPEPHRRHLVGLSSEAMKGPAVADLVFIVIVVAFFALCVGYVRVCDRIIGPDAPGGEALDVAAADEPEVVAR